MDVGLYTRPPLSLPFDEAAPHLFRKPIKREGRPEGLVTDRLKSYGAVFKDPGRRDDRATG